MKVVEITAEPILHGGQEKFIANLVSYNDDQEIVIDVITPHYCDNRSFRELIESKKGSLYELHLPFSPGKSRRLLLKPMTTFLKEKNYDVAHIHSGSISALAYIAKAAKSAGVSKRIVHSHSTGEPTLQRRLKRLLFSQLFVENATDYLACSVEAGEMKYPRKAVNNRLVVVNNGIMITDYCTNKTAGDAIRNQFDIPKDAYVIGHVGRFTLEKNHNFLINLFDEYSGNNPNSVLLLVGDGELKKEIMIKVKNLGLQNKVIFVGNVDNVQDYYKAMNVFLLPSAFEGFSFATLEAQAAGLPCIISTAVPDAIMIGKNIKRIELENRNEWIRAIKEARSLGIVDNTEAIIDAGYDITNTVKQIQNIYWK